jgi:hypothetical protein
MISVILDNLAVGLSISEILKSYSSLSQEDIFATLLSFAIYLYLNFVPSLPRRHHPKHLLLYDIDRETNQ